MTGAKTPRLGAAVRLTVFATVFTGILQAAIVIVMARFVGPKEYGAYALCIAVLSVSTNFVTASTERALIVAGSVDYRGVVAATFALLAGTSVVTLAICYALAKLGWMFVRLDLLATLLFGGVLVGMGIAPRVFLRRKLEFRWIVVSEICGLTLGTGVTAIALAKLGFGVFALVGGTVVQNTVTLAVLLYGGAQGVSLAISRSTFKTTARGTLTVSKLSGLEVVNGQIPNFFLNQLGPTALGLFNRSQTIVQLPVQLLTSSMTRVMISGISAVTEERERFIRTSRLLIMTTSALIGPVNFGIAGSHVQFTEVLLGKTWSAAAPLVPIMALTSWGIMTATVIGVISEAARHFRQKAIAQGFASLILIICLAIGIRGGLLPATIGIATGALVLVASNVVLTAQALGITHWRLISWFRPGLIAGLGCGAYSLALAHVLRGWPASVILPLQILGCGAVTTLYFLLWRRDVLLAVANATLPAAWGTKLARLIPPPPAAAREW